MWEDAVGSTGVHEETPVRGLVQHVDQLPGGDRVHCKSEAFGKHFYQVYGTLQSALVPSSRNIIKKA